MKRCPVCGLTSTQDAFCPRDGARLVEASLAPVARGVFVPASAPAPLPTGPAAGSWQAAAPASAPAPLPTGPAAGSWQAAAPASAPASAPAPSVTSDGSREAVLQLIGTLLDQRYLIEREIGSGGMGVVFKATHVLIDKPVAIKVMRPEHARQADIGGRFAQEARIASKIKHPNVVEIVDYGVTPLGCPYYVMEYVPGRSLATEIDDSGRLSPARAIDITLQMTRGLAEAHRHGVVHRDLKPDNVVLLPAADGRAEQAKILDFGIARVAGRKTRYTAAGALVGTPEYMSPEQASGREVDHRTDLYALGTLLFEMLTSRTPFRANAIADVLSKQVYESPPTLAEVEPSLPPLVHTERVLRRLLAKAPEDRPINADEVVRLLEQARAADLGLAQRPAGFSDQNAPRPTVMLGSGSVNDEPVESVVGGRPGGPRLAAPAAPLAFFAPNPVILAGAGAEGLLAGNAWAPSHASPPSGVVPPQAVPSMTPASGVALGEGGGGPGAPPAASARAEPSHPVLPPSSQAPVWGAEVAIRAPSPAPVSPAPGLQGMDPRYAAVAVPTAYAERPTGSSTRAVRREGPGVLTIVVLGVGAAVFAAFATLGVVGYLQRRETASAGSAQPVGGGVSADTRSPAPQDLRPAPQGSGTALVTPGTGGASAMNTSGPSPVSPAGGTTPGDSGAGAHAAAGPAGEPLGGKPSSRSGKGAGSGQARKASPSGGSSSASGSASPPAPPPDTQPDPKPDPAPSPSPPPDRKPDQNGKPVVDYGDLRDPFGDP